MDRIRTGAVLDSTTSKVTLGRNAIALTSTVALGANCETMG
jgi:hypothetical protein